MAYNPDILTVSVWFLVRWGEAAPPCQPWESRLFAVCKNPYTMSPDTLSYCGGRTFVGEYARNEQRGKWLREAEMGKTDHVLLFMGTWYVPWRYFPGWP